MISKLAQLLATSETVVLDGAMGTMLFAAGLESGASPESWNESHPDRIGDIHRQYIQAGSQIILTNSFGGTRFRLKLHNLQSRVHELNRAAARIARLEANNAPHLVLVAGSMGPTGELLVPLGSMEFRSAREAFAGQARGLVAGGVDLLWIETMSDLEEVRAAVEGIRSVTDLPVCATMSFDTNGRTMMGTTPEEAVRTMSGWGLDAIGANCGNGTDELEDVIHAMHREVPDVTLIAKANAGLPQWRDNVLHYDATPSSMAEYAQRVRALGASLIGGCCGNGPEHIRAIADTANVPLSIAERETLLQEKTQQRETMKREPARERSRRRGQQ